MPRITIAGLGKRGVVVFENNETLFDALTKFCFDQQLRAAYHYGLRSKMQRGKLDLGVPFRFSGLTNNAEVELIEVNSSSILKGKATISLKAINFELPSTQMTVQRSLYQVLMKLEKVHNCVLLNKTTQNNKELIPVVTYGLKKYTGKSMLVSKRLIDIGIVPNVLARFYLSYNISDIEVTPQESTSQEAKIPKESKISITSKKSEESNKMVDESIKDEKTEEIMKDDPPPTEDSNKMTDDPVPEKKSKEPTKLKFVPLDKQKVKDLKVFIVGTGKKDNSNLSSKDFELSGSELKHLITSVKSKQESSTILKTRKIREMEAKKNERVYTLVIVRVKLPNGYIIQGSFKPSHKLRRVYHLVRSLLFDQSIDFDLFTTPPRRMYNSEVDLNSSLKTLKFEPAIVLHASSRTQSSSTFALNQDIINPFLEKELEDTEVPQHVIPPSIQKPSSTSIKPKKKSIEEKLLAKMGFLKKK